ncbi:capping complex subunit for YIEGIA [Lentibacillus saliphilus]|uniref:capping complex subunit for YIEGIA n=1 Tax=Lentibacillus saliphilus TaxID=2737028 RepID=UPI001C2F375B|nr:hypothetical protein [Lentibacillus saliphilus]
MAREASMKPDFKILAYVTTNRDRIIASNCLALHAQNDTAATEMTADIAKALKADVVQLTNDDFMIIRV